MLAFAQFGSELDSASQKTLDRGKRATELLLKQPQHETYSFVDQTIFLFLLKEDLLDSLKLKDIKPFATQFASYVKEIYSDVYNKIKESENLDDITAQKLKAISHEFQKTFPKKQ